MDPITAALLAFGACFLLGSGTSRFRYRETNGAWRAYFNGTPPSISHVLHDDDGYYVCWDRPLGSEHEARQVASRWMESYG